MRKKIMISALIVTILMFFGGIFVYFYDPFHFKIEYELYNQIEFDNGKKIVVSIPYHNKIKYVKQDHLQDLLTSKSGPIVIYFGYSTCPWCRNIIPILTEVVGNSKVETLYYVDVKSVKTEGIRDLLKDYLREDDTGNKRLYVPDVYFIKDGEIAYHHIGSVDSYKDAFKGMNEEQKQELRDIYQTGIKLILGDDQDES